MNTSEPDPEPETPAAQLRVALARAVRRIRAERVVEDLADGQFSVLAYLDRNGPATPGELAGFERVQPPSITRTLAGLAGRGLVTRSAHPDDGRQVIVSLTAEGTRTVRETRLRRDTWLAARLAELDPDERDLLARAADVLRRIADQ